MQNTSPLKGYAMHEYMLVLQPHEDLRNKINEVRKKFSETYKATAALYDKPHIMLASFTQYAMAEERIVNRLNRIAMGYHPTRILLKDYGSFPSHTIYIQVTSRLPVQELVKTIRAEAQLIMKADKEHKPHFILEPHISIARKLQPWQYEKGWLDMSHRQFTGSFIADGMLLLKRAAGEKHYQIVQRFAFQNLPVHTTQGALFS
jgi:2'-5' RNA ligase